MRIAIVGSRDFCNLNKVAKFVVRLPKDVTVITGDGPGVDSCVVTTCIINKINYEKYDASWDKFKGFAGPLRNAMIVSRDLDMLVAFVNDKECLSPGAKDCINQARAMGVKTYISDWR